MNKPIWLLTYEVNEYDQYGEYFQACFFEKPTISDLIGYLKNCSQNPEIVAKHLLETGGGRLGTEYLWFYLTEINQNYDSPRSK